MAFSFGRGSILNRIRAQTLTLNQRLSSIATSDQIQIDIKLLASHFIARIDEIIKVGSRPLPLVFGAEVHVNLDMIYSGYPENVRLKALLVATNLIRNIPEIDKMQIYHANIFYRSLLDKDKKTELRKDDIITRVVSVAQSYPKVGDYKVTEETHFKIDLGFDKWDCIEVLQALQVEFKLYIPDDIISCKLAIEYIYDHRKERLDIDKFRRCFVLTKEFWESKAEFRRIFVRDAKTKTNYIKCCLLDSDKCETFSWNDFLTVSVLYKYATSVFCWTFLKYVKPSRVLFYKVQWNRT